MEFDTQKENEIFIIKPLDKRIDASCSTNFKAKVIDFLVQGEKHIILNLEAVDFVDSSGLGAIISILKAISSAKGTIVIYGVNSNVSKLFTITRLNTVLTIVENKSEAITKMSEWFANPSANARA